MAQYLLSVWHAEDEDAYPDDETMQRAFSQVNAFNEELQVSGSLVFAGGLEPPSSATVVRATDGGVATTDGPLSGAAVQIGGFWVIETRDRDAALEWSRKASTACMNPVEVRPFQGG